MVDPYLSALRGIALTALLIGLGVATSAAWRAGREPLAIALAATALALAYWGDTNHG